MAKVRLHAYFSGQVQGVFFRNTTVTFGKKRGVTGWVQNLPDGRVELISEGEKEVLQAFIEELRNYRGAQIDSVTHHWLPATGEYASFRKL
ncbi:MAG: acylphosphatase [bacterium]|nr:acylphosphatase [bacterium]